MSDHSKDKPPTKLKLSRDIKPAVPSEEAISSEISAEHPAESRAKLPTASPPESSTESPPETPPIKQHAKEEVKAQDDTSADPFTDVIKQSEIQLAPTAQQPQEKSQEEPQEPSNAINKENGSDLRVEAAVQSMASPPSELSKGKDQSHGKQSLVTSILVIFVLFMILILTGFGLWKVLQEPEKEVPAISGRDKIEDERNPKDTTDTANNTETSSVTTHETTQSGPIQRAQAAVAKRSNLALDPEFKVNLNSDVENQVIEPVSDIVSADETTMAESVSDTVADQGEARVAIKASIEPAKVVTQNTAHKRAVTEYLSSIHIGGMRQGSNPMILLEGKSFLVGDIVHQPTGLKFDGFRSGRLVFRDQYEIVYLKSF